MQMKLNKKTVGGAFLIMLVLLIFCSRTIYAYNLPKVSAVKPTNGKLNKSETSSGLVEYAESENVYVPLTGTVESVLVKVGDHVGVGQDLFELSYDREEAERKLRELDASRVKLDNDIKSVNMNIDKAKLNIQSANMRLEKTRRYMSDLQGEVYEADAVSRYDLDMLEADIAKAEDELDNTRFLFELGDLSGRDLEKAEDSLKAQYARRDNMEKTLSEQEEKNAKAIQDKEKSRESKIRDYEADIASIELELRSLQMDLDMRELDIAAKNIEKNNLAMQEEQYKKTLQDYESNLTIKAPISGFVTSLGAAKGERVAENRLVAVVGSDAGFIVRCKISLDNNFVILGDTCDLTNATHRLKGTVAGIEPETNNKAVTIELASGEVSAGETFEISFRKNSAVNYTLVPNGALNQDNDGYYLNQVRRRDGMLGKEFHLVRVSVHIGDSDLNNTAIVQGITFFEPLVLVSDKAVAPGDVVALVNESDFFEK